MWPKHWKFQHNTPSWNQYTPHKQTLPNYGATKQLENPWGTPPPIPEKRKKNIQQTVVNLLYYACNVDCTMLPDLNTISEQQSYPTQNNEAEITNFLDYAATNHTSLVKFKAGDMVLHIDSDASYLYKPRAYSCTGRHY